MPKKLLLADDSVVIQKLVGLSFANEDIEIVSTDNGDDALAIAREIQPDVVLADVVMPGLSGYEVCKAIKHESDLAHTPVLLLTGTFEVFDESRAEDVGADGQVTKPFEAQALVERVTEIMSRTSRPAPSNPHSAAAEPLFSSATLEPRPAPFFEESPTVASPEPEPPAPFDTQDRPADPFGTGATGLFGEPGEAQPDAPELQIGDRVLGQSIGADTATDTAPPMPPHSDASDTTDRMAAADVAPAIETGTPLSETIDLENLLGMVQRSEETGLLTRTDEHDATTSPNVADPEPFTSATPPAQSETMPFARPDEETPDLHEIGAESVSSLEPSDTSSAEIRDLDAVLGWSSEPATPTAASQDSRDRLQDSPLADSMGPLDATTRSPFDVSEQLQATPTGDAPLDDSLSSLMDLSEDQVLPGAGAPPVLPPEAIIPGYDVSTSDLAATLSAAPEAPEPPTFEPLAEVSDLPDPFQPRPPSTFDTNPLLEGEVDLLEDLSAGSPLGTFESPDGPMEAGAIDLGSDQIDPDFSLSFRAPASPITETRDPEGHPPAHDLVSEPATAHPEPTISDISPLMEQRIQETLEKVAWEAFSDLSETIVKQVMDRVEKIAWEVIPEMAETLVREEIRKLKDEDD